MFNFSRRNFGAALLSLWHSACRTTSQTLAFEGSTMEPLPCTWLDRTGDLKEGVFYKFSVADEDALRRFADPATAILSKRVATDAQLLATGKEGYLWVEAWGEGPDRKKFECSTYPTHQTSWQLTDVQYALRKSGEFADFVSDAGQNTGPGWFVSGDFADGLRTSGLKGFRLDPVKNLESVCEEDRLNSVRHGGCSESWRLFLVRIATVPVGASTVSSQRLVTTTAQREARQAGR